MALEDLATLRAIHGSIVLYPADAACTARLTTDGRPAGIVYLRTTRGAYPVMYPPSEASRSAGRRCTAPDPPTT